MTTRKKKLTDEELVDTLATLRQKREEQRLLRQQSGESNIPLTKEEYDVKREIKRLGMILSRRRNKHNHDNLKTEKEKIKEYEEDLLRLKEECWEKKCKLIEEYNNKKKELAEWYQRVELKEKCLLKREKKLLRREIELEKGAELLERDKQILYKDREILSLRLAKARKKF